MVKDDWTYPARWYQALVEHDCTTFTVQGSVSQSIWSISKLQNDHLWTALLLLLIGSELTPSTCVAVWPVHSRGRQVRPDSGGGGVDVWHHFLMRVRPQGCQGCKCQLQRYKQLREGMWANGLWFKKKKNPTTMTYFCALAACSWCWDLVVCCKESGQANAM